MRNVLENRVPGVFVLCAMAGVMASCGVMPIVTRKVDPTPFQAEALAFLEPGRTTQNALVEQLGQPTLVRKGGRMLIYAVAANTEPVLLAGQGSPYTHYYLFVDLSGDGTVESFEAVNSEEHGLRGIQGTTACRASGACVLQDPWIWLPPPPWAPLGEEVLPKDWDIAVVTDTAGADANAKAHVPGPDECLFYVWGVPAGYSTTVSVSINGGAWRSLLYETVLPQSHSRRTFVWRILRPGAHVLRAAILDLGKLDSMDEYPFECTTKETLHIEVSEAGARRAKLNFNRLTLDEGRDRLRKSRVVLE